MIIFVTPRADSWGLKEINPTSTSLVSKPPKKQISNVNPGESGRPGQPAELHDVQLTAADKELRFCPSLPFLSHSLEGKTPLEAQELEAYCIFCVFFF